MGRPRTSWQNRIVNQGVKPASQFLFNPANFRKHPKHQRKAINRILKKIGWVQQVIENSKTGNLIDGHERVWEALQNGDADVPYIQVDLTPQEEKLMLTVFDQVTVMAEIETEKLEQVIQEIKDEKILDEVEDDEIEKIILEMQEQYGLIDRANPRKFEDISSELPGVQALKDVKIFPSTLPYGIPELLNEKMLELPEKTEVWDGKKPTSDPDCHLLIWGNEPIKGLDLSKTVVCFFTDDTYFEKIWLEPAEYTAKFINAGVLGVILPLYSIESGAPDAVKIWQRYRSMWLGRYFQEAGVDVLPAIKPDKRLGMYTHVGLPAKCPLIIYFEKGDDIIETDIMIGFINPSKVYVYTDDRGKQEFSQNSKNADKAVYIKGRIKPK